MDVERAIVLWGATMVWSATVSTYSQLLLTRVFLGAVTAAAGPVVASLVGDCFAAAERGRIYGYILAGELAGAGVGFAVTGDIAALSWRAAFLVLALPAFVLAWMIFRLREPVRGGSTPLVDPSAPARRLRRRRLAGDRRAAAGARTADRARPRAHAHPRSAAS